MRKLETAMVRAMRDNRSAHCGDNTVVTAGNPVRVTLHGNLIAEMYPDRIRTSLAGWNTPTTRSRLNAMSREFDSPRYSQYHFDAFCDGDEVDPHSWQEVPRFVGLSK